jgi:hypothetical protein
VRKFLNKYIIATAALLFTFSCAELDIENPNNADIDRALQNPDDVKALIAGGYNTWYVATHSYNGVGMLLATAADNITCSWGNQGMRDMSWEPRKGWDNAPNYSYSGTTDYFFYRMYRSAGAANTVLKRIADGMEFGDEGVDTDLVEAFSYFVQGISLGYVGLVHDQGYAVNELSTDTELANPVLAPYDDLIAMALAGLDKADAIASSSTFIVPSTWIGTADMSSADFSKVINSFAARILAYSPRNATQNAALDWNKVKSYASKGVDFDFAMDGDGYNNWPNGMLYYLNVPTWGRVDMRVVNMMDPNQPAHWEDNPDFTANAEAQPTTPGVDKRLFSNFEYLSSNNFRTERGYYHFSVYRHSRYDDPYIQDQTGLMPEIFKSENDLLLAEAEAHLGSVSAAAAIINAGTRVTNGELDPVAAVLGDVLDAIDHERQVELMTTGMGIQFFHMRKYDLLQYGTPLHLPIPATILEILDAPRPFYTFGGPDTADGINVSNGGWR